MAKQFFCVSIPIGFSIELRRCLLLAHPLIPDVSIPIGFSIELRLKPSDTTISPNSGFNPYRFSIELRPPTTQSNSSPAPCFNPYRVFH